MNTVTIEGDQLIVRPGGLDRLWSFRRRIDTPLRAVRGATADTGVRREPKGRRGPGLRVPGKYAGTFRAGGETTFWNVSDPVDNVVIELDGTAGFDRLVLTVADPQAVERAVNAAI
ncbi:hypothetical protein [Williamsia sterculiae]|uniref:Bacterial Pleckstrin homology domain-containing protein n=1 Tax=Williamsia sterculiae TaxID=1344003 RepID=A0A1N7H1M6_9NOCA|nr:hypothetical protein [Williamsia sterculiae]SIS18723.1 hypothetical protein SAMN05445060_3374 [Williamsia sterculiae]